MSKSQLADAAGVSRKTFSEWLVPFPARSETSLSALSMAEPMSSGAPNLSCPRTRPDSNGSCSSSALSSTIASTSSKRSTRTSKRPLPCARKSIKAPTKLQRAIMTDYYARFSASSPSRSRTVLEPFSNQSRTIPVVNDLRPIFKSSNLQIFKSSNRPIVNRHDHQTTASKAPRRSPRPNRRAC